MLIQAAKDYNIDLSESIMIGDTTLDIKMAENAGMKSILVLTGEAGKDQKYEIHPTVIADDLLDAVNIIFNNKRRGR